MQSTWAEEQLKPNLRRYHANGWRITGYDWSTGFQRDSQSSGLIAQFCCSTTNFPRIRSFMPVAAYYSSFSTTSAIVLSTTAPAKKSAIILDSSILVPTSDYRKRANAFPTDGGTEPAIAQLPTRPRLVKTLPSLSSKNTSPRPKATKTLPSLSGNDSPS